MLCTSPTYHQSQQAAGRNTDFSGRFRLADLQVTGPLLHVTGSPPELYMAPESDETGQNDQGETENIRCKMKVGHHFKHLQTISSST